MDITTTLEATTPADWRTWLEAHHASAREVWLVFYKKHTGVASVTYAEALEEALCFGWIDGIRKRVDEARFAQRFTPRRAGSAWSDVNLALVARLEQEGRMTAAGRGALPAKDTPRPEPAPTDAVETALQADPQTWAAYQALPPSHRRRYLGWIGDAKREETRQKRLSEALQLLKEGKRLGIGPGEVRK